MTSYKSIFSDFRKKSFNVQVLLGDNSIYVTKGKFSTSFKLDSSSVVHIDELL